VEPSIFMQLVELRATLLGGHPLAILTHVTVYQSVNVIHMHSPSPCSAP